MLKHVSLSIAENAEGANGPENESRSACIHNASDMLTNFVCDALLVRGIDYGTVITQHVYTAISDIVAEAMVDQYNYDKRQSNELIDELLDDLRRRPVPRSAAP